VSDIIQTQGRSINIGYERESDLPHETFHSIQGFLAENYPAMLDKLNSVAQNKKEAFTEIYKQSPLSKSRGAYGLEHMIESKQSSDLSELPYGYATNAYERENKQFSQIKRQVASEFGKDELIPQLMTMATGYKDKKAQQLLSEIFSEAGLRSDFMEQKFFFGGKVDPLAKKYGLNQSEFLDQQKIAKFMGLDSSQFEEKLSLFSSQKKRLKGKKFSAIDAVADTSVAGQQVIDQQKALEEYLKGNKFAAGGRAGISPEDTVPALLTPGEFVINRNATSKHFNLLNAINNGTYSHGEIAAKFNTGGYVNPNYYRSGSYVSPAVSRKQDSFDFAGFMQKLMGQLSSVISEALREGSRPSNNVQNLDNRSNGVSIDTSILDRINEFTNRLKSVADTLAGLNAIPSEIKITGKHDINVVINGDSALNQLRPELQQLVMNEIKSSFQRLVNQNSPLPSDKLINPFDSNIG
jgi:hypothetical protein